MRIGGPPSAYVLQATRPGGMEECRSLYVGNLHPKVTDALLFEVFSVIGPVEACKIIKNYEGVSLGYGFVDYPDHQTALYALQTLNGKKVYEMEFKVNWALMGTNQKEDTSEDYHLFVGDLSSEIDESALREAFSKFGSLTDARIVWDPITGRSKQYGFVAFRLKSDAERALVEMDQEWLGRRPIRLNWANQKSKAMLEDEGLTVGSSAPSSVPTIVEHPNKTLQPKDNFESVFNSTVPDNNSVYVGNLPGDIDQLALQQIFGEFGPILNVRHHVDKGFAFVNYVDHISATRAIVALNLTFLGSNRIKCSWGKEKPKPVSTNLTFVRPNFPNPNMSLNNNPNPINQGLGVQKNPNHSSGMNHNQSDLEYDPLNPN